MGSPASIGGVSVSDISDDQQAQLMAEYQAAIAWRAQVIAVALGGGALQLSEQSAAAPRPARPPDARSSVRA